jgi:hypothetical protein
VKGIVESVKPVNAFNGDHLLELLIRYKSENPALKHNELYEETAIIEVMVRNVTNPKALIGKAVFGTLTVPRKGHKTYLVLEIKTTNNVRNEQHELNERTPSNRYGVSQASITFKNHP